MFAVNGAGPHTVEAYPVQELNGSKGTPEGSMYGVVSEGELAATESVGALVETGLVVSHAAATRVMRASRGARSRVRSAAWEDACFMWVVSLSKTQHWRCAHQLRRAAAKAGGADRPGFVPPGIPMSDRA